ncbi:MAG: transporter [Fimbriimonadaceae bacterium]|nr:transporter [Fimbriimonadaceae bacterium]
MQPDQAAVVLDAATAAQWLEDRGEGFLWLHFTVVNTATEPWLRERVDLPDSFYEAFRGTVGSTRLEQDDETLVAVLHDVLFDFTFDPAAVSVVALAVTPRLLVSARRRPLRSIDRLRSAVRAGANFRSPADLLGHLLRDQADVLVDITRQATARVDRIEDHLLANQVPVSRRELGTLRRVLVRLQRLLAPEPAAFFRLLGRPPHWIPAADLQDLREAAEEFSTAVLDSTALCERVRLLQDELAALVSEATNRTLFVLTVVTVLALPINLIAGLFGMNVAGMPLATHPHGFGFVVGGLLVLTVALGLLAWRRQRE